jgi:hypothetical protein
MRRTYTKDDVQFRYEHGRSYPAVNVKVYKRLEDGFAAFVKAGDYDEEITDGLDPEFTLEWIEEHLGDEQLDREFWHACEHGWEMLETDAHEVFGKSVRIEAQGRQGGWCVVTNLDDIEDWDAIDLAKWRKFERWARQQADDIPYQIVWSAYHNYFVAEREEAQQREHWANHDLSTEVTR